MRKYKWATNKTSWILFLVSTIHRSLSFNSNMKLSWAVVFQMTKIVLQKNNGKKLRIQKLENLPVMLSIA